MRDPGLPVDGAPACPFVAFEDDRDARATAPDHRHRCYAEPRPAPRALAHQEAYCLSSAFAVCPTFQDWARREAAAARPGQPPPTGAPRHETEPVPDRAVLPPPEREQRHAPAGSPQPPPLPPHRPVARDWAAPPPWLNPDAAQGATEDRGPARRDEPPAPPFLAGRGGADAVPPEARGLAGSGADRVAGGRAPDEHPAADARRFAPTRGSSPDAGRFDDEEPAGDGDGDRDRWRGEADPAAASGSRPSPGRRDTASGARGAWDESPPRRIERRDRVPAELPDYIPPPGRHRPADGRREESRDDTRAVRGPSWEQPRRFEAYPTLKTRIPLPSLPGSSMLVALAALLLAAVALFFLPALLGVGEDEPAATPTPSASVVPTPTPEPTPEPAPTPIIHVVAEGETLSAIASQYGLTLTDLLAANPQITDPNRIAIGDELTIPAPEPSVPDEVGDAESPTPS